MRSYKGHRVAPRSTANSASASERRWRVALWWTLAAILILMLGASPGFAISADEPIQNWYGHMVVRYFESFGADKTALTSWGNMCFYGGLFDAFCTLVARISPFELYDTRHFVTALSGFGVVYFTAMLARYFSGYPAAIVAAILLAISPAFFGESMNNPKDVPFALGMTAGLYAIVKFISAGPRPSLRQCAGMALAIAFAINIRIGGLLLIPYLCLFALAHWWAVWRKAPAPLSPEDSGRRNTEKQNGAQHWDRDNRSIFRTTIRYAAVLAAVSIAGWFGGVLFWPYGLNSPILNPLRALKLMSNAYIGATVLFDGQDYPTWQVPARYLPQWMAVSTPLLIVFSALMSPLLLLRGTAAQKRRLLALFFAALFPLAYIIAMSAPLYDAWRHVLFIYPPLIVLSALVLVRISSSFRRQGMRAVLWLGFGATLIPVGRWMIRSHPMQMVYYNELVGGVKGAYGKYETDFYAAGMERACTLFAKEANLDNTKDTIRLATNFWGNIPAYYLRRYGGRIKYVRAPYEHRYDYAWDYGIFRSRGVDCYLLQYGAFPPAERVAEIAVDSVTMYALIRIDPAARTLNMRLTAAIKDSAWARAIPVAEEIIRSQPYNETVHPRYALALLRSGRREEAWKQVQLMLRINELDEWARALYREMSGKEYPRRLPVEMPPYAADTASS